MATRTPLSLPGRAQVSSLRGALPPASVHVDVPRRAHAPAETAPKLVAASYRGRDYYLRRLLALADASAIVLALGLAVLVTGVDWRAGHLLIALLTVPVWLVMFNCYGLYQHDAKRLAHTTIDDIPGLFHAVLIGGILMWGLFRVAPGES